MPHTCSISSEVRCVTLNVGIHGGKKKKSMNTIIYSYLFLQQPAYMEVSVILDGLVTTAKKV